MALSTLENALCTKPCSLSRAERCAVSFSVPKKCQKAREHFGTVRTQLESLKTKFPTDQYYRCAGSHAAGRGYGHCRGIFGVITLEERFKGLWAECLFLFEK